MDASLQPHVATLAQCSTYGIVAFDIAVRAIDACAIAFEKPPASSTLATIPDHEEALARIMASRFADYLTGRYQLAADLLAPFTPAARKQLRGANPEIHRQLCHALAQVAMRDRRLDDAKQLNDELLADCPNHVLKGCALLQRAKIEYRLRRLQDVRERVQSAIREFSEVEQGRDYHLAAGKVFLGWFAFKQGFTHDATVCLDEGDQKRQLANVDDRILEGRIEEIRGCTARVGIRNDADRDRAERHFRASERLYLSTGHGSRIASVRNNLGRLLMKTPRLEEARQVLESAAEFGPEDQRVRIENEYFLGRLNLHEGRSDARETATRALARARRCEYHTLAAELCVLLARIALRDTATPKSLDVLKDGVFEARKLNRIELNEPISRKTEAAINLCLAEWHTQPDADKVIAEAFLTIAENNLGNIDNSFLRKWANDVRQTIGQLDDDYRCTRETEFDRNIERLRFWSVCTNLLRAPEAASTTERLDVVAKRMNKAGRTTTQGWLDNWKRDLKGKRDLLGLTDEALDVILRRITTERQPASERRRVDRSDAAL